MARVPLSTAKENVPLSNNARALRHEFFGDHLYRSVISSDRLETDLLAQLESEFKYLLQQTTDVDDTFWLAFPPMKAFFRSLVSSTAGRYHLETRSFDDDEKRFVVVIKHPHVGAPPLISYDQVRLAKGYYIPKEAPPATPKRANQFRRSDTDFAELTKELADFTCCPKKHNYSRWAWDDRRDALFEQPYEGGISSCFQHFVELVNIQPCGTQTSGDRSSSSSSQQHDLDDNQPNKRLKQETKTGPPETHFGRLLDHQCGIPGLVNVQPLPTPSTALLTFSGIKDVEHIFKDEASPVLQVRLTNGMEASCQAVQVSMYQKRPATNATAANKMLRTLLH
eukprot:TRINITY_DN93960_c0_g1_i1.p1 TRINITY_DN93960_c0_g1~~TRINITY_DN93960_c0_g1_i1.p1  ORF type:complete len:394 (-),score=38.71 TRINITY_DN93960_c0_g1_i1:80-1093(-)